MSALTRGIASCHRNHPRINGRRIQSEPASGTGRWLDRSRRQRVGRPGPMHLIPRSAKMFVSRTSTGEAS